MSSWSVSAASTSKGVKEKRREKKVETQPLLTTDYSLGERQRAEQRKSDVVTNVRRALDEKNE